MSYRDLYKIKTNGEQLRIGMLLLSEPFMRDSYFLRSVVLFINQNAEGSMGLVLNKRLVMKLNDIIPEFKYLDDIPLFNGGPVGVDSLFYVHSVKEIRNSLKLGENLYLNGDFEDLKKYVLQGNPIEGCIRFFRGYAGWTSQQLEEELRTNSWIISTPRGEPFLYEKEMWKKSMKALGGKYAIWADFPLIPAFN